jgi:hypothetical protein
LIAVACAFSIFYAIFFKQKVLERIDKEILMVWTTIGLYIAFQTAIITAHPPVLIVLSIFSVIPVADKFRLPSKSPVQTIADPDPSANTGE